MKKLLLFLAAVMAILVSCGPRVKDADAEYAKDLLKPGEAIPDFTIPTVDDSTIVVTLADVTGQYLVLDFWASWCPDCRADIPAMKELYDAFGKKAHFMGVNFDTDKEQLAAFLAENEIAWEQVGDFKGKKESDICDLFHIKWIPSMYLVDPEGNVVLGTVMVDKLRAALEKL